MGLQIFCGVDIIETDRIRKAIESGGEAFLKRVFTPDETGYCESRKAGRYMSYAARFAAKEAVSKALGTGLGEKAGWLEIETLNDENGKPRVHLSGKALERYNRLGGISLCVSLSHCECHAVAQAVLLVE